MSGPITLPQDPEDSIEFLNKPEEEFKPLNLEELSQEELDRIDQWQFSDEELAEIKQAQQTVRETQDLLGEDYRKSPITEVEKATAKQSNVSWAEQTLDTLPQTGIPFLSEIQENARYQVERAQIMQTAHDSIVETHQKMEKLIEKHEENRDSTAKITGEPSDPTPQSDYDYLTVKTGNSDAQNIHIKQLKSEHDSAGETRDRMQAKLPQKTFYLPDGSEIKLDEQITQTAQGDYKKTIVYDISANPELAEAYGISGEVQHLDISPDDYELINQKLTMFDITSDANKNAEQAKFESKTNIDPKQSDSDPAETTN